MDASWVTEHRKRSSIDCKRVDFPENGTCFELGGALGGNKKGPQGTLEAWLSW